MKLEILPGTQKDTALLAVERYLEEQGLTSSENDKNKPWGAYYVISSSTIDRFIELFFLEFNHDDIYRYGTDLRPKILVVAPGHELSWQYHERRAELWKSVHGPVGFKEGRTDKLPNAVQVLATGSTVQHIKLIRHRLIGLDNWGVVAEIWQHTDPLKLSDEEDIVRVQDNYGR